MENTPNTPTIISDQKSSSGLVFLFSLIFLVIGIIFGYLLARYFPISNSVPQKTCTPRPACLDATPRCMIPETSDMCPPTITLTPTTDKTADWKTYTNEKFGLSFQYPQEAKTSSKDPDPFPVVVQVDNLKPRTGGGGGPEFEGWVLSISETQPNPKNISLRQWAKDHKLISDISIANEVGSTETLPVDMYIDSLPVIKWTATGGDASNDLYLVKRPIGVMFIMVHDNFGRDIETTNKILSTFKFTGSSASNYQCPASGYVDCMPILSEEGKRACSAEAMAWYKANCPDFKGTAL